MHTAIGWISPCEASFAYLVELVGQALVVFFPLSLAAPRHTFGGKMLMAYCSRLLQSMAVCVYFKSSHHVAPAYGTPRTPADSRTLPYKHV